MIVNYKIKEDIKLIDYLNSFYLGKSKIYTLFLEKRITKNNEILNRESLLSSGDIISINYDESLDFEPLNKKLNILYEDDYLLIINKPNNIIVHPDDKTKNGTLCNVVAKYYQAKNLDISVKYAHRLDIQTTGIIIFCKDSLTMSYMNHIISTHELKRYYLALVSGKVENQKTIDAPIGEDRHHKQRRRVSKTGDSAVTHYRLIKSYGSYSLVKILLETGRTHQIRVHMSYSGNPLLGDELYGGSLKKINRVALHSYSVEFIHPVTGMLMKLKCEMPFDMKSLCD